MAEEPDNLVLAILREIRSGQDAQAANLDALAGRVGRIERQLDDLLAVATDSLGQEKLVGKDGSE